MNWLDVMQLFLGNILNSGLTKFSWVMKLMLVVVVTKVAGENSDPGHEVF
jgi:hypothetical protein